MTDSVARQQPSRIGRYRIDGVLGRGAMGMVYLGRDEDIERDVAIKTIHRALLERKDGPAWLARFRTEVRAAGRCLHPNIVTIFEYGEMDGLPFIVMEYVDGRELRDWLKEDLPMSPGNAVLVVLQVLQALGHAHAHGVVHRDVKPANIIVLADGQVKVTDFGIARLVAGEPEQEDAAFAIGTPGYMAPEQFRGREADPRADLYSAGVVLFELLTGTRPFRRRKDRDLVQQVLHDPLPRATELNAQLPAAVDALFERALAKSPNDRFQDASALAAALEGLALVERELGAHLPAQRAGRPREGPVQPSAWDEVLLGQIERWLVELLGPVARVMVRRAAASARDARELLGPLAAAIPDDVERRRFLQRVEAMMGTSSAVDIPSAAAGKETSQMTWALGPFDRELLESARRHLAVHLGPIAKVLVKRAAATSQTPRDLYVRLAEHLTSESDREAFLEHAPNEHDGDG